MKLNDRYEFICNEFSPGFFIYLYDHKNDVFLTNKKARIVVKRLSHTLSKEELYISDHIIKFGDFPY